MGAPYGGIDMITGSVVGRPREADAMDYDDWLMMMVIKHGIDQPFAIRDDGNYSYGKFTGAKACSHMVQKDNTSEVRFTDKAKRYLDIVNMMNERNE